jgi:hypothetical protein
VNLAQDQEQRRTIGNAFWTFHPPKILTIRQLGN